MKRKPENVAKLKKKLDSVFSHWIRKRDSNWKGDCVCCTCGAVKPISEMHNGHYWSRSYNNLRYDETNCHAQCPKCNIFHEGAKPQYTLFLTRKYGTKILKELEAKSRICRQFTTDELKTLIEKYKH